MSEQARDYEAEARKEGWVPQEDWKGPEDAWKPAEQFVKDGENINGILRKKVDRLETRVEELLQTNEKFKDFSKRALDKEKKENDRLIKELEVVRKQAVTDGDGDAFARADEQLQELRSQNYDQPDTSGLDPAAQRWLEQNPWYQTDDRLGAYADGIADRLRARGFTGAAYWDELTRQVKETFPDHFGNPNRRRANGVEGGGERDSKDSKAKTWENLPEEAKRAYTQFKRDIPGFKKEDFLAQYDWEQD